jgi:hypothetical protein
MSLLWSLSPAGALAAKNDTVDVLPISFKVCPLSGNRTARLWCRVNPALAAEQGLPENKAATALLRLNKALPPYTAYGTAYLGATKNGPVEEPLVSDLLDFEDLFVMALGEEEDEEDEEDAVVEIKAERPRRAAGPPDRFVP